MMIKFRLIKKPGRLKKKMGVKKKKERNGENVSDYPNDIPEESKQEKKPTTIDCKLDYKQKNIYNTSPLILQGIV